MNTYTILMRRRNRVNGRKLTVTLEATDTRDASQRARIDNPEFTDILIQRNTGQEVIPDSIITVR